MQDIKQLVHDINHSFQEFKARNDQRLSELEKGRKDPLLETQVDRLVHEVQDLNEVKSRMERIETQLNRPLFESHPASAFHGDPERKQAINSYLRKGENALTPHEVKLLSTDSDPQGGYWVTSEISQRVIMQITESSPLRHLATVETISSDALEIPEDLSDTEVGWTSETGVRSETDTPTIGVRRIPVHELYAMPKATQKLLDDARVNVEEWLSHKIAAKMSYVENSAFINGDGIDKPRGLLTYPAGMTHPGQVQQVNSGHASQITADGLRAAFYALKTPYIRNARWMMSRATIEVISKLKDGGGSYLWEPGIKEGEPQMLLGHPIERMEDMPSVSANALPIAFGDWKQAYTIVDRSGVRVLRDPFSAKPFVLFYTTKHTGGDVTNFEALVIQKIAA
ncbi:phage major capsid protein [Nitrospina watsonii]|uniref:Phage major capsid protein n=1 Tax=Nitrospina watsonii TaxID=1323948 RepID=A0ABN8W4K6_9BACT|nr:phage major capsid protein [Nitrospina watsonii]CAI2719745.1 Phage major capsid protein [Nitrospina watsonii]